ncbi:CRP-like cAMP-binding protein [Methylohalomonas lacus]|uniref:CRP-like cAMP-binding protein n=1 Tax=Methylohalomonas lacus TaxID=398773 RepID=A0AAE3HM97_9GAMM|nr:cyclic nucleotide-binding domain-containing protein [Methylohalomonas lacus]MCS3903088.1 CRP-like cAMP-binding protein [Methylohalomonas lacus]
MKAPQSADPAFQQLQPLAALSATRRQLLFSQAELRPLHKGARLFETGAVDSTVHYLIEGRLELRSNGSRWQVEAGDCLPLAPLQPRLATARALSDSSVLCLDRGWFDALLLPALLQPLLATDQASGETSDWLQRLLESPLFKRLPAANLQQLFSQCEALAFSAGQNVIEQNSHDGAFYIIQSGHCDVAYCDERGRVLETIAQLGPGDWFGEVSLLAGVPHSMTVTMHSDGALLRLSQRSFDELLNLPLFDRLDEAMARQHLQQGAQWLDVRETAEVTADPQVDARHVAVTDLVNGRHALDKDKHYLVVCDSGARSAVAAFVLAVQGYTVSWLQGGLVVARGYDGPLPESEEITINNNSDPLLQSLRNELTGLLRQVDNAMRLKRDAEAARREAERAAVVQMHAERERLNTQSRQVREMLEQTQQLQKRLVEEKQRLYAGVRQREQAMERRVSNLNTLIEQRVAEERKRITEQYQAREAEIERLQQEKQRAEKRLHGISDSAGDSPDALEAEFDRFNEDLRASEEQRRQVQTEAAHELVSQIGDELAAGNEEFSDYQDSKEKLSQEREQLQSQAQQLSAKVQQTLIDKQATQSVRQALQEEAAAGTANKDERNSDSDTALRAATARYEEAEQEHQHALDEQQENAAALARTEQAESDLLEDMNAEIENWMQEQAQQPRSAKQQALIQRYESTMQRMQKEAAATEEQERTRDDLLLSDINAELETIAESRAKNNGSA